MKKTLTKLEEINLRHLAEINSSDRAFLSLYYSGKDGWERERKRLEKDKALLAWEAYSIFPMNSN